MKPRLEKARIGWWVHTPGGRRMWCATRWWAERELKGYDECWTIGVGPDTLRVEEGQLGIKELVVRLDDESVAALWYGRPLPDTAIERDDHGMAMVRADDGLYHYVVRLSPHGIEVGRLNVG